MKIKEGCLEIEESKYQVINFYKSELNKYKDIVDQGLKKLLDEERTPYLKQLNALYDIYLFQNYLIDYQNEYFNNLTNKALILFFSKTAGDIFSLRQCLMVGQIVSASVIERNIFETFVNTKLILEKDTGLRSQLFEEFQDVQIWERMKTYKKYIEELNVDKMIVNEVKVSEKKYFEALYKDIDIEILKSNYERIKENYHPQYPHHWAWKIFKDEIKNQKNPNLGFICKKLGLYSDYLHVYSTTSLAVHNQPLLANMMTKDGNLTSIPIFSENTNSIAGISAGFVIDIILMIIEFAKSKSSDEIEIFLNHFYKENFID